MAVYESGNSTVNSGNLSQIEVHLYGSSRLGMWTPNRNVQVIPSVQTTTMTGATNGVGVTRTFKRGQKFFELSNHLGNVLVTVTDRKVAIQNGTTGTILNYVADVVSGGDYYPFGMQMPSRNYSSEKYRYGFNGKEKDKDLNSLTAYDYGFRIYNPAIGKFLSVDPLTKSYPWYTPYQFAGNKPVWCIDLDGLEEAEPKPIAKIPLLTNASESTCQNCAERQMKMKMIQGVDNLEKLRKEYEVWANTPENIGKPIPPQYINVAPKSQRPSTVTEGGVYASKEYKLFKAGYDTYGQFLPGISDIEDGANLIRELDNGNYKMAAMYGLFLLPGGDYAKPAKDFITRLAGDGIEYALKNVGRLQHAFKHAKDIKQFAGKNWNNGEVLTAWKKFNTEILETATKSFDNVLGADRVKGFYKKVDGQNIATYVYKDGDKAGEIATTVVLSDNQMKKFALE